MNTSLQPIGVGTSACESLSGYVQRLAAWHGGNPGQLLHRVLSHIAAGEREYIGRWRRNTMPLRFSAGINGFLQAKAWIAAVEECSGTSSIRELTTCAWDHLFSPRELRARHFRWCGACLGSGAPHRRLVWTILSYRLCLEHGCALSEHCPGCGSRVAVIDNWSRVATCSRCGSRLCDTPSLITGSEADLEFDRWASKQVAALVAADDATTSAMLPLMGLRLRATMLAAGVPNLTALARMTGTTKSTAWTWWHGRSRPTLPNALRLCSAAGITLLEGLAGLASPAPAHDLPASQLPLRLSTRKPSRQHDWRNIARHLQATLVGEGAPSLASVGRGLDIAVRTLRKHEPRLCHAITRRHRSERGKEVSRAKTDLISRVEVGFRIARERGAPTSQCEIARIVGQPGLFRRSAARRALQQLLTGDVVWSPAVTFPAARAVPSAQP